MSQQQQARDPRQSHWLSRWLLVILAALVLTGAVFAWAWPQGQRADAEQGLREQIGVLQTELEQVRDETAQQRQDAMQAATGQDMTRQDADDAAANELIRVATSWDGVESYIQARDEVKRRWNLTEDSPFMQVFMPGEAQGAYRTDPAGNIHFAVPGANSRLVDFEATLTSVEGDRWTYFAQVRTATDSPAGGSQENWTAMVYTVDGQGTITEVMAYPSNQAPQESGA